VSAVNSDLARHLAGFARARIACIGDVMLDRYIYGHVDRISPEAPIPVLKVERETAMLGGVGNVARNVVALGGQARLIAAIGDDEAGRQIAQLAGSEHGLEPRVTVETGRQTTVKTRLVAGAQQLLRADRETAAPISAITAARLIEDIDEAVAEAQALVLSDYAKGVLNDTVLAETIARAQKAGRPVIADPKSADFSRYRGVTLLTPNRRELMAATGMPCGDEAEIIAAARRAIERAGVDAVLATLSERGMALVTKTAAHHLPAEAREVYDVSGAGDTVVATLALALAAGADLEEAAQLANRAAGIVVGKAGTAVVHPEELAHALGRDTKVLTLGPALDRVATWRRQGARIGFTNGVFDLLHPGHVSLLAQARARCDRLVVGLNSDASVKRLKGAGRPVQAEAARAQVLAAMQAVDLVIVFGEDTPVELIRAVKPELLVKGADYTVATVVGAELVQSWGGEVYLADLTPGASTTSMIARAGGGGA
jgi:D-beta-D-heptose 7-phosphate kinase / D-beta-D-heptose 1-phosphate adenosyltransferase